MRYLLLLILLTSCTRKSVQYVTKVDIQRDTIQIPVYSTSYIPVECDSNGILKAFNFEAKAGASQVRVYTDSGRVIVRLKTDTIIQRYRAVSDTIYVSRDVVKEKKVTPGWMWAVVITSLLFAIIALKL